MARANQQLLPQYEGRDEAKMLLLPIRQQFSRVFTHHEETGIYFPGTIRLFCNLPEAGRNLAYGMKFSKKFGLRRAEAA